MSDFKFTASFAGDSLNSCRYSAGRRRCSFSSVKPLSDALSGAADHLLPSEASSTGSATLCLSANSSHPQNYHKTVMLNPNKAVFTFDFKSMKVSFHSKSEGLLSHCACFFFFAWILYLFV